MIQINLASKKQSQFGAAEGTQSRMSLKSLDLSGLRDLPLGRMIPALIICIAANQWVEYQNNNALNEIQLEINKKAEDKAKLKNELDATKGDRDLKAALEKDEELIRNKINTIQKLMEGRRDAAKFLFYLSDAVPQAVWLRDISSTGQEVFLKGVSTDYSQISEFIKKLSNNALFEKVELKSSALAGEMSTGVGMGHQNFEIQIIKREVK